MGQVAVSVVINRPVGWVFEFVTDLRHDIHWYKGVQAVLLLSEVDRRVGTRYEQRTKLFGVSFTATMTITEYDPPHQMTLVSSDSLTPFVAHYRFDPVDSGSTQFTLSAEVSSSGAYRFFGPLFVPLVRAATNRRLRILKRVLEAE